MPAAVAEVRHITKGAWVPEGLRDRLRAYNPRTELGRIVKAAFAHLPAELAGELLESITRVVIIESSLRARIFRADADGQPWPKYDVGGGSLQPVPVEWLDRRYGRGKHGWGRVEDCGILSRRVITDAGVAFLVDAFQNSVEWENMKFHGLGNPATANAEAAGDTALQSELTTQYNPNNTRATGTTTESAANIFRSVGSNTLDAAATIKEHGLLSQAATGGGTLWDRSAFDGNPLSMQSGETVQTQYDGTLTSGG